MSSSNIPTTNQYPKLSKASSGYLQIEHFKNADLHTGYFCYNCVYFIKDNHCAIVEDTGPDVRGEESGMIAPHAFVHFGIPTKRKHDNMIGSGR